MVNMARPLLISAALLLCTASRSALADDLMMQARANLIDGYHALQEGKDREALVHIMASWQLVQLPFTALWAARVHDKLNQPVQAARMYSQAITLTPDSTWPTDERKRTEQLNSQNDARAELELLSSRIQTVRLECRGCLLDELEVRIDGAQVARRLLAVPLAVDPGEHTIVATSKRGETLTKTITITPQQHLILELTFAVPASSSGAGPISPLSPQAAPAQSPVSAIAPNETVESSRQRTVRRLGWVGVGIGTAGLVLGATAGIAALVVNNKMNAAGCDSTNHCPRSVLDQYEAEFNRARWLSSAGFIAGGAVAFGGLTLLLSSKLKAPARLELGMALGPSGVDVLGAF